MVTVPIPQFTSLVGLNRSSGSTFRSLVRHCFWFDPLLEWFLNEDPAFSSADRLVGGSVGSGRLLWRLFERIIDILDDILGLNRRQTNGWHFAEWTDCLET